MIKVAAENDRANRVDGADAAAGGAGVAAASDDEEDADNRFVLRQHNIYSVPNTTGNSRHHPRTMLCASAERGGLMEGSSLLR